MTRMIHAADLRACIQKRLIFCRFKPVMRLRSCDTFIFGDNLISAHAKFLSGLIEVFHRHGQTDAVS